MGYTKLEVRYYGDGLNTQQCKETRQGVEKKVTITLPKKVIEYGDRYGYSSISVSYNLDHIILRGGGEVLLDRDINGGSNEYIRRITGYDWLY